jgi:hypothetical protein
MNHPNVVMEWCVPERWRQGRPPTVALKPVQEFLGTIRFALHDIFSPKLNCTSRLKTRTTPCSYRSLESKQLNGGASEAPQNACCMNLSTKPYGLAMPYLRCTDQTVCGRKLNATERCDRAQSSSSCEENLVVALKHAKIKPHKNRRDTIKTITRKCI